jgi:hypothetical protein
MLTLMFDLLMLALMFDLLLDFIVIPTLKRLDDASIQRSLMEATICGQLLGCFSS